MSKFFQMRFNYSNEVAGHISSMPYTIASFATPLFGTTLQYVGEGYYEQLTMGSLGLVIITHMSYILMSDSSDGGYVPMLPMITFGLGHAFFVTLMSPTTSVLFEKDKSYLPQAFS
eukprot:CAMPEP_0176342544 /NCGR_PEP_ID=MMETSP0126-20121128/3244_1 /TAXON_ID=141414 ORGANISM="Strombidinopsis acuminatum, Strain SPMC142" /NCGR_SAMPLE_ID=MMETSP0126 /ASSEMBLY_ACC=CAM_ASM_000229 /LENGTH=115 /DNA_ID=CAMNT_0017687987 /DNA_START=1085 /DNA_END=1432 /DNA_ORIENTATION=+